MSHPAPPHFHIQTVLKDIFAHTAPDMRTHNTRLSMPTPPPTIPKDKPASVLVPIVNRPTGATILLTGRARHLRAHAGQISFPGGRPEAEDRDIAHTALREAEEEIGLPQTVPQILGYLAPYNTGSNYTITPVVSWLETAPALILNKDEVDYAFEMPLSFILDTRMRQTCHVMWHGSMRQYYVYDFEQRYIWGATAGILSNLADMILSSHMLTRTHKRL